MSSPRRLEALRRMATQNTSPNESAIAAAKLAEAEREDDGWRIAWANQQEHERIREERARAAREAEYADIVRRWQSGTFSGLTARLGATGPQVAFRKRP